MGMKNPLIMNMEPGEEETMKAMTASSAKMAATCEQTSITAGGGTPDTEKADQNAVRLGKEAMRKRKQPPEDQRVKSRMPSGSAGANNYKLPTRHADGSGTGI